MQGEHVTSNIQPFFEADYEDSFYKNYSFLPLDVIGFQQMRLQEDTLKLYLVWNLALHGE